MSERPQGNKHTALFLYERAFSIRAKSLGESHEDTVNTWNDLEFVRAQLRAGESTAQEALVGRT